MGREQRGRIVQHQHASGGECAERPQTVVDSVQCREHVEASERDVARDQLVER